jgi:regulatory protein
MASERKYSLLEAKTKLEALCAYQERCSFDLNKKLMQWGFDQEDRDRLLADLISNNFLSEERYAEAFVSGKFNIKKWGRIKIRQQLKQKRISDYSINKGLSLIDDDRYIEQIENLCVQKMRSMKSVSSYADKVKVYRFLSSKGYETELIRDIVDPLFDSFNG